MDHKINILKQHLIDLGYNQTLPKDAVPLVDNILSDLIHTTKSLKHYKNLSEQLQKEYNDFKYGVEPYKCDNAKLFNENNNLSLQLMKTIEENDQIQRKLKHQIRNLEQQLSKSKSQICKLECELSRRHQKKTSTTLYTSNNNNNHNNSITRMMSSQRKKNNKFNNTNTTSRERECPCKCEKLLKQTEMEIENLNTEVTNLKDDNRLQIDMIESYKAQLKNRDNEIDRLLQLLKNGRSYKTLNQECCYKDVDEKISLLTQRIGELENDKIQLEIKLTDAVMKQHEAMKNAVSLAEKNHKLENELLEVDRMALTVESDCNKTVRENNEKIFNLQSQLNEALTKLKDMEKQKGSHEFDCKKFEQKMKLLVEENQMMTEKIAHFTVIEYDLNTEVDRLTKMTMQQKYRIDELEFQLKKQKSSTTITAATALVTTATNDRTKKKFSSKLNSVLPPVNEHASDLLDCCQNCRCKSKTDVKDETTVQDCLQTINRLQAERDFYWRQYERQTNANSGNDSSKELSLIEIRRQLYEKDQRIQSLQEDVRDLSRNKHNLEMQLHEMKDEDRWLGRIQTDSTRSDIKKLELERDIAMGDVTRLEEERNDLRCRLQIAVEKQKSDSKRYEAIIKDLECRLRKLEDERHCIILETGNRGATINKLEDKLCEYKEQLENVERELSRLKSLHCQQKALREQTDAALGESQCIQGQLEKDYQDALCRIKSMERDMDGMTRDLTCLRNENQKLQTKLCKLDQERDSLMARLDDKTEEIECLREELRKKDNALQILEGQQRITQDQLSDAVDNLQSNESLIKCLQSELNELKRNLNAAEKAKECLLDENRKLQNELASVTGDYQVANQNLELAQQEIEDLKLQLQGYISEVSRIEDLLDQKEKQRDEMLSDFRQLSAEANVLENNNNSLETEASAIKFELNRANEKLVELKNTIQRNECLLKSYCNQITTLTSNVARLECEIQQISQQRDAAEQLCRKLEKENDALICEMAAKDEYKNQLEAETKALRNEFCDLKNDFTDKVDQMCSLEDALQSTRAENQNNKMQKEDLQKDVCDLNDTIERLQCKLTECRFQVAEYRTKIIELEDEIVNITAESNCL